MKKITISIAVLIMIMVGGLTGYAHCQVPCGIYDDGARVEAMLEDVATVTKAMQQLTALAAQNDAQAQNQRIRWVMTKEEHAQKIINIIANYFLTQRVKPSQKDYLERLVKHHKVILLAMKVKQSVDVKNAAKLRAAIEALSQYYPEHKHSHEQH